MLTGRVLSWSDQYMINWLVRQMARSTAATIVILGASYVGSWFATVFVYFLVKALVS